MEILLNHSTESDAISVDVIHTETGFPGLGYGASVSHADFWPHVGTRDQPRCSRYSMLTMWGRLCSHVHVVELYVESVKNVTRFESVDATGWIHYRGGFINSRRTTMGASCNNEAR